MRGTAMGQPLTIIVKQKVPNKMKQDLKFAWNGSNDCF